MRKIILNIFLASAYLFLALAVAALFWRAEAGWGAGAAALIAALGLGFGLHNMVTRNLSFRDLAQDLTDLRQAHGFLTDQLEQTQLALEAMAEGLVHKIENRSQSLIEEVKRLETVIEALEQVTKTQTHISTSPRKTATPQTQKIDTHITAFTAATRSALRDNRIDLYLQPIMTLPQRRPAFYECFSWLRDEKGTAILPEDYLPILESEGLIAEIDSFAVLHSSKIVKRIAAEKRKIEIFCNISSETLGDATQFPQFQEFFMENRTMAGSLIFEMQQEAFLSLDPLGRRNMKKLIEMGFRFSLDHVAYLDFDIDILGSFGIKFLKINADFLSESLLDANHRADIPVLNDVHYTDYASWLRRSGVEIVATHITKERQVVDILDLDISFGQGHLFGKPRIVREQMMADIDVVEPSGRTSLRQMTDQPAHRINRLVS